MRILIIHGPNLNLLGKRKKEIYGDKTLSEIDVMLQQHAKELGVDISTTQSNSEGNLIDFIQKESPNADGIIINPGALTHYGLSLRDALSDTNLPVIEVHLSNIYAREEFRHRSVIAPIAKGQVTGLGWRGYIAAMRTMVAELRGKAWQ
ncbi:MAG: type II 3-dehydroquinate dehydratase [Chloroflexi bacterium]|jgi:3-dehydroquinate dehydratase II|nr:type II 3-dehydroquinate dehydratase [Chloroflexota bacterium]